MYIYIYIIYIDIYTYICVYVYVATVLMHIALLLGDLWVDTIYNHLINHHRFNKHKLSLWFGLILGFLGRLCVCSHVLDFDNPWWQFHTANYHGKTISFLISHVSQNHIYTYSKIHDIHMCIYTHVCMYTYIWKQTYIHTCTYISKHYHIPGFLVTPTDSNSQMHIIIHAHDHLGQNDATHRFEHVHTPGLYPC